MKRLDMDLFLLNVCSSFAALTPLHMDSHSGKSVLKSLTFKSPQIWSIFTEISYENKGFLLISSS